MQKAKKILFTSVLFTSTLLTACKKEDDGPNLIQGEVEVEDEKKEEVKKPDNIEHYDYRNLPPAEPVDPLSIINKSGDFSDRYDRDTLDDGKDDKGIKVDVIYSYYARALPKRSQIAYREILSAALNRRNTVNLTKSVSKSELEKIMNIMFLDTPEAFMLDTKYQYNIDSVGNVSSVNLYYSMSPETQALYYDEYTTQINVYAEQIRTSENTVEAVKSLAANIEIRPDYSLNPESFEDAGVSVKFKSLKNQPLFLMRSAGLSPNLIGIYKSYVAILREAGIDAAIMVGQLTNPEHYTGDLEYLGYNKDYIKEDVEGSKVTVTCDYSRLYAWIKVCINKKWYNVDTYFPALDKSVNKNESIKNIYKENSRDLLFLVDDYLIAQSRIFYMNDELLGQSDPATGRTFQKYYRKGLYVPDQTEDKIANFIDSVVERMPENKGEPIIYQFGSRDNFSTFVDKYDERVGVFNRQYKQPIRNYKMYSNDETLTIIIYDIVKRKSRT